MVQIIISAFVLGLFGSLHCMGMCGPLVMSMPFQNAPNKMVATMAYHIGKTITYALMGLIAGVVGQGFAFLHWQQLLSIIAGVFLLIITLVPILKSKLKVNLPLQNWFSNIFSLIAQKPKLQYFLAFGFVNGLLPCGLVYAALAGSMVTSHAFSGMLFMAFFGIGTIPSLTAIIIFQGKVGNQVRQYLFKSARYISILVGLLLILRGFNLGIPYISPALNPQTETLDCCHKH